MDKPTKRKRCETGACIDILEYEDGIIRARSGVTSTAMQCTRDEWRKFRDDIKAGAWDHIGEEP